MTIRVRVTVKQNQKRLYDAIDRVFVQLPEWGYTGTVADRHRTIDKGHGRIEIRDCWIVTDSKYLDYAQERATAWPSLEALVKVRAERQVDGERSVETRYFIASTALDAEQMLAAIRAHWHIESSAHWILDVAFREDYSRVRTGYAAQNLAVLRQMALNLLKAETTETVGVKNKRLKAAWDENYLVKVLTEN